LSRSVRRHSSTASFRKNRTEHRRLTGEPSLIVVIRLTFGHGIRFIVGCGLVDAHDRPPPARFLQVPDARSPVHSPRTAFAITRTSRYLLQTPYRHLQEPSAIGADPASSIAVLQRNPTAEMKDAPKPRPLAHTVPAILPNSAQCAAPRAARRSCQRAPRLVPAWTTAPRLARPRFPAATAQAVLQPVDPLGRVEQLRRQVDASELGLEPLERSGLLVAVTAAATSSANASGRNEATSSPWTRIRPCENWLSQGMTRSPCHPTDRRACCRAISSLSTPRNRSTASMILGYRSA